MDKTCNTCGARFSNACDSCGDKQWDSEKRQWVRINIDYRNWIFEDEQYCINGDVVSKNACRFCRLDCSNRF